MLEGIYDLILETVVIENESILIVSNRYPTETVKSKFLKLNSSHVEYVLDCLRSNARKVKNIKKYLLLHYLMRLQRLADITMLRSIMISLSSLKQNNS